MTKQNIEIAVRLDQKTLFVNGKSLKLEDNLVEAESSKTPNSPYETALDLKYLKQDDFSSEDEAEKIYLFLKPYGFSDKIEVNFKENDDDLPVFPAIGLAGDFNATIYD